MNASQQQLDRASRLAQEGEYASARSIYQQLLATDLTRQDYNRIQNDLSAIAAVQWHTWSARLHASRVQAEESNSGLFAANRQILEQEQSEFDRPVKVALLSLLFNWPSTGGGTVHTKELADFLTRDGYEVLHLYAANESFGVGKVTEPLGYESRSLSFTDSEWNAETIRQRFQTAVHEFDPDWAIVTDSWNTKPLLAEAVRHVPYFLRIAAQECLCPLNNVRMLFGAANKPNRLPEIVQCDRNQLVDPSVCQECVLHNAHLSGGLHKAERLLAGFHDDDYSHRLKQAFAEAEGVLVVNPQVAALVEPHTPAVHVVPSGFDPSRFPVKYTPPTDQSDHKTRILFAGLREELMKGFHVLQGAAEKLSSQRQDFEVWVTGEPQPDDPAYIQCIGWQSQEQLTQAMVASDLLIFPTVAQEALGRSAVEAMGCGRPVLASRIGGLSWVIEDEQTGLLFEPGDVSGLFHQLERLLDDRGLRERLGRAGQRKFQQEFTWDAIFARAYRTLFGPANKQFLPELQEVAP